MGGRGKKEPEKDRNIKFFFFWVGLAMWWVDILWGPVLFTCR